MKKGDLLQLKIDDVAYGAEGIARENGRVIFVERALPGEEVTARIVKKRRDFARARPVSHIQLSPHRVEAPCSHIAYCGGCKWQDVDYLYQLELKHHIVAESLGRTGGFPDVTVHPVVPSPEILAYRNKMEFSFAANRWILPEEEDPLAKPRNYALGFHIPGRFDKILDIDRCWLQSDWANGVLELVKQFALDSGQPAWDTRKHTGFWRYLVLREGKKTDQRMVNIVTYDHKPGLMKELTGRLLADFPELTGIVNNVTSSSGGSAFGEKEYPLAGSQTIDEKLGDYLFEISANSFFQTNTLQAEKLFQIVIDYAHLAKSETVFDLYSGTGAISILVSKHASKVIGFEAIPGAVENAKRNAARNQVNNCQFILEDLKDTFRGVKDPVNRFGEPEVVIVDPPRAGMHPKTVAGLSSLRPGRIVYVSCNPTTFARDVKMLCDSEYTLIQVQPVDMFPHTYHIELVAQLELKG
jgi:23S rRNA (uracil1939-C5)-methyltransferase